MVKHKFLSKLKAAIVGAAMIATSVSVPVVNYSSNIVTAAVTEVSELPHTLIANGVKDGPRQANFVLTGELRRAKNLIIKLNNKSENPANVAVYGFGISKEPYWVDDEAFGEDIDPGSTTITVPVPAEAQGRCTKVGIGVWYPDDGSEVVVQSITADGLVDPIAGESTGTTTMPTSENDKSGTYTFTDNGDGTATITATLSAQYTENGKTEFNIPLTQGYDEETHYAPFKDKKTGEPYPEWKEGDPINSHHFKFTDFGIDDLENIKFQSFEYVVTTKDYNMDNFQYGGGINVVKGSPADTESVNKDGYWYNDHSEEEIKENGYEIEVHGPYIAEYCGNYAKLAWDVPASVQPYVEYSNSNNSVGFQYWWGRDESKPDDANNTDYTVIPEVYVNSCTATYTRTMTVPYNKTEKASGASSLTTKGNIKLDIAALNLGKRDKLSAIKFHIKSASELQKFVSGFGISTSDEAGVSAFNTEGNWYQPGNICVINTGPEFDVMVMLPENIRNYVWGGKGASAQLGMYYADKDGGEEVSSVSVPSIEYYIFRTQEADLIVYDDQGIEVPDVIELEVGDEYQLHPNVKNCDYTSSRPNVASVDGNGLISALERGITVVTVTTPEGQKRDIQVRVTDDSDKTEPSTEPSRKYDPKDVDWEHVLWGDVDVNGAVELADVTELSKNLLSPKSFPLKNATAKENADCKWDHIINTSDLSKLIEYNLGKITMDDLGPEDWEIRRQSPYYRSGKVTA
jgi:hypothetical protein